MGFSVDTATLGGLPSLLDRLGDDAHASRLHLVKHTDLAGGEGLLNLILGSHRALVAEVKDFFGTVEGKLAAPLSTGVRVAVNYYRQTDAAAAAAFDATLPATTVGGLPTMIGGGPGSFGDRAEPQDALVPPRDYSGTFELEHLFPPLLSPGGMSRDVVWRVTALGTTLGACDRPIDPYIECVRPFVGDWAGFRACADVFEHLAVATERMSANVYSGAIGVQSCWQGNAADGCRGVLVRTERALAAAANPLRLLAERYKTVAEKTHDIAGKVAGLLVEAVDYAAMALLAVALAGVTGKTIVGGIAFSALAIERIVKCVETLHRIALCVKAATEVVLLGMKAAKGLNIVSTDLSLPSLPSGAAALPSTSNHRPI
jgi:hypothetical protein